MKNKTALLLDYIRDCSADLYAITETGLTDKDASVKAESSPAGYNFIDYPRTGYRDGGTGLNFRDSLRVKMVDAGGKDSFEFSEWLVSCLGCSLRLLIVYRPPYSTEHKVTVSVFLREFSDYLESFVLSKEQILIAGDFNIHVDDTMMCGFFQREASHEKPPVSWPFLVTLLSILQPDKFTQKFILKRNKNQQQGYHRGCQTKD